MDAPLQLRSLGSPVSGLCRTQCPSTTEVIAFSACQNEVGAWNTCLHMVIYALIIARCLRHASQRKRGKLTGFLIFWPTDFDADVPISVIALRRAAVA